MALAFRIIINKKEAVPIASSLVYSKSVHKVFIALFVEYALCFVLCHNLRPRKPKLKPVVLEKQFFLFHVLDLNPIFGNQDSCPL